MSSVDWVSSCARYTCAAASFHAPSVSAAAPLSSSSALCMRKARDWPPAKANHARCIPMKSQRASKPRAETASFAGEPALSKLGTETGVGAARGDSAVLGSGRRCAPATPTEEAHGCSVASGHLESSQDPPVCPPAHPTHRESDVPLRMKFSSTNGRS